MYQYYITNETSKSAKDVLSEQDKKKKELEDKIANINSKFDISESSSDVELPEELKLEKLTYEDKSKEEIEEEAKDSLATYYNNTKNSIYDDIQNKENEYLQNIDSLKSDNESAKQQLSSYYDDVKQSASDDALKRGLARSSIVINKLEAFDKDKLDKYAELDKTLSNSINAINFELSALQDEQDKALSNFEIEYASKLNDKINDLTKELEDKKSEVIKYNNEIEEKEKEYEQKLASFSQELAESNNDKITDILEYATENGYSSLDRFRTEALYYTISQYLSSLSKEDARYVLESSDAIKNSVPDSYYKKLLTDYAS